jgi:tetratricopeptide (TPR) repeat protein
MLILTIVAMFVVRATTVAPQAPDSSSAANALFRAGRLAEARDAYLPAARRGDARAAFWLGVIAMRTERFDQATDWLTRAIAADERQALYHVWLGYAYDAQRERANIFRVPGLAAKARSEFERAIALDSTSVDAHVGLANKYLYMPRVAGGSVDKARAETAIIRRLNPYRGALVGAALAAHTGDHASARRELETLRMTYPDSAAPVLRLAELYLQQHQADSAVALLQARLARAPDDSLARRALARIR